MSVISLGWQARAACRAADPSLFAAPDSDKDEDLFAKSRREKRALKVCAFCRVREECLAFAVATDAKFGVWGGLKESELAGLQRRTRRTATVELEKAS